MNSTSEKSKVLEERLIKLSATTIKEIQKLPGVPVSLKNQLVRAIASVGANYAEANNASSKADFKNKLFIAKKEAGESIYWIKVVRELKNDDSILGETFSELNEIIRIFQKAINTINNGSLK